MADVGTDPELDALESIGEAFQEACEHAARLPPLRTARLGPLVRLPMSGLWPGEFGWARALAFGRETPSATILCFLLPGATSRPEVAETPLPDVDRSEYEFLEVLSGPPWHVLAARGTPGTTAPAVRKFARAVADELRAG
ncbi:MAG: hypothetical protein L3J95_02645 [Thermoplasmata archaeon]|nr:hypothetical protein [Thermoplasmata archaeon]MCI4359306.1 hypothetical protein [Thermoplasmata archaeon]